MEKLLMRVWKFSMWPVVMQTDSKVCRPVLAGRLNAWFMMK